MNFRSASLIGAITLATALFTPSAIAAPVQVFTDRAAFEKALGEFTVDNLDGVTPYHHGGTKARSGYQYATPSMYGCINHAGCFDNSAKGFDNAYLWNYIGTDTFTFNKAVNGFGFNFDGPRYYAAGKVSIDGVQSHTTSGFYGLLYSDARKTFTVDQNADYMLMDNVTAGMAAAKVPEPSLLGLMGIAMFGVAFARRRRAV